MNEKKITNHIKSYAPARSRMTKGQKAALERCWPKVGLSIDIGQKALSTFTHIGSTILEIGIGMGDALIENARNHPDHNYLGVDVYKSGMGRVCEQIEANGINNIRLMRDDAVLIVEQCIGENTLDEILIFFPDPWQKRKHHKRRLIQPAFVNALCSCLKQGGILHCATDWDNYAKHMMQVLTDNTQLSNVSGHGEFASDRGSRSYTKFERRGETLGHRVFDLVFIKI